MIFGFGAPAILANAVHDFSAGLSMANLGPMEIVVILVVVLVIFGPKNLPKLGSALGKTVKNVREGMEGEEEESEEKDAKEDAASEDKTAE